MGNIIVKSAFEWDKKNLCYKLDASLKELGGFDRRFAGAVTENDIADIKTVTVLEELLGIARPLYVLNNAVRVEPTDTLELTVDVATKLSAQEDVPDFVEADLKKQSYTPVSFDLLPNVVHVAVGGKAGRQARHNVLARSIEDGAKALAASKNSQIATVLNSGTRTGAGGNWTSDNPYTDINMAIASVEDTYEAGIVDTLAAPRSVWSAFFSNDKVKGQLLGASLPTNKTPIFSVPGLPGIIGIMDTNITAAAMVACDKAQYAALAQGPIEAEGYRNPRGNYNAWIVRDWKKPKLTVNNAGYVLTALLS